MIPQDNETSTQHRILSELLIHKNGLSIDALAKALNVSRNAIQQHFSAFERNKLIRKKQVIKTAGRPVNIYELTDLGINYFPKQYAWFSEIILSELHNELGEDQLVELLARLGKKIAQQFKPKLVIKNDAIPIVEVAQLMSELGFQANADITPDKQPVIQATNCIYHDLAKKHPFICTFDVNLVKNLVDRDIDHSRCMAKGDCLCEFKLK